MLVLLLLRSYLIWFPLPSLVWSSSYDPNALWVLESRFAGSAAEDGTTTRAEAAGLARPCGHPALSLGCAHTAPALHRQPTRGQHPRAHFPSQGRDEPRGEALAGPRWAPRRRPKPYSPWDAIGWQPKWLFWTGVSGGFYRLCFIYFLTVAVVQSLRSVHLFETHGLWHARPPCPSWSPRACSNSCPLSQWCHPTTSSCHPLLHLPSIFPSLRVFSSELALQYIYLFSWAGF